jgi:hypothetical protein
MVFPLANDGADGVNDIDTKDAGSTVNVVDPDIEPEAALIATLPAPRAVATPRLSIETTLVSDEAQVTAAKICVLPSLKTPVATKGWMSPCGTDARSGVMTIEASVEMFTVRVAEPPIAPRLALMVTVPLAKVVARPLTSIEATEVLDEAHVT